MRGGRREGAGRPAGVPNKANADLRALAQQYTEPALKELARLALGAESETARVAAIKEVLDRGHGKASEHVTIRDERDLSKWNDADLKRAIIAELEDAARVVAPTNGSGLTH